MDINLFPSLRPVGKIKTSSAAQWSLRCAGAGFLVPLFMIVAFLFKLSVEDKIILWFWCIGVSLGTIGLILGIISLVRTKRPAGLIISLLLIIFTTLLVPLVPFKCTGMSKNNITKRQITEFTQTMEAFQNDISRYPTTDEGLDALIHNPGSLRGWNGPYLKKVVPPDPWGRPYHYRFPGEHNPDGYDLWSDGADGIEGTKDDIANFK